MCLLLCYLQQLLQRKQKWKMKKPTQSKQEEKTPFISQVVTTTTSAPIIERNHPTTETAIIEKGWRVIDNGGSGIHKNEGKKASFEEEEMKALFKRLRPQKPIFAPPKVVEAADDPPQIHIIQEGSVQQIDTGQYKFVGSITLVQDEGKNMLVDTGLSTDYKGKERLLESEDK